MVLTTGRDEARVKSEVLAMRERLRNEHGNTNPLKHGHGGLLDIEFVVQLGLLLNAAEHPDVIGSTQVGYQLKALHECGWINANAHHVLDRAYAQLSHARLQAALLDDSAKIETAPLLDIAQALCDEILG